MEGSGKERKGRRGCVQWECSIILGSASRPRTKAKDISTDQQSRNVVESY